MASTAAVRLGIVRPPAAHRLFVTGATSSFHTLTASSGTPRSPGYSSYSKSTLASFSSFSSFSSSSSYLTRPSPPFSSPRSFTSSPSSLLSNTPYNTRLYSSSSSSSSSTTTPSSSNPPPTNPTATMADAPRPTGTIATKGIELLTLSTPNGYKVSVLLEELKDAYGIDYTWQLIEISQNIQKEPWFTALNPNGRIPVIVDHDRNDLAVFEGAAILNYLVARFDKDRKFSFDPATEPDQVAIAESWIAWQHGGLGPMQGQANHFLRYALDKQSHYAVQRYVGETERLYGVLNTRLADRDFIAGTGRGKYSIADMAAIGWASGLQYAGVDITRFPHVEAWVKRCHARPATARGFTIPREAFYADSNRAQRLTDPEAAKKDEASLNFLADAQKQFNYKYTSP